MDNDRLEYLVKQSKKNRKKLEYDFMPGLIEIIEKPTNKGAMVVIWTSFLMIISVLIWSYFSKVDVVNECRGVVASSKGLTSVVSYYTGRIDKVYVKDDDTIKRGDKILDLVDESGKVIEINSEKEGIVTNMSDLSVGSAVQMNQELLKVIPNNSDYKVKINISNKDIADIELGDKVNIKLDAYSYGDYGMVEGEVIQINRVAELNAQEDYCFASEIKINKYDNKKINLMNGMTCTVDVNIGQRRIIDYILEPVVEALEKSVKEK